MLNWIAQCSFCPVDGVDWGKNIYQILRFGHKGGQY